MTELYEEKTICGKNDKWFDLSKIPTSFLPKNFHCYGSLSCDGSSLIELPEGLIVEGNLYIGECEITALPPKLIIGKDLILLNSSIFDIPNDICICGDIIAIKVNNMPSYKPNTIYSNFVCDKNGKVIPYLNKKFINRKEKTQFLDCSVFFYSGLFNKKNAVIPIDDTNIYLCESLSDGCNIIDHIKLKKSKFYNKYLNYDIDEKRFVKELTIIFKEISNACDSGIKKFFENSSDIVDTNKYSIRELCKILEKKVTDKNELNYIKIFKDYFFNREIFFFS